MCASLVYWTNKTDSSFALLRVGGFNPPQHWSLGRIIISRQKISENTKDLNSASRHLPKGIGYIHDFSHFLLFILSISGFEIAKAAPLAHHPSKPSKTLQAI